MFYIILCFFLIFSDEKTIIMGQLGPWVSMDAEAWSWRTRSCPIASEMLTAKFCWGGAVLGCRHQKHDSWGEGKGGNFGDSEGRCWLWEKTQMDRDRGSWGLIPVEGQGMRQVEVGMVCLVKNLSHQVWKNKQAMKHPLGHWLWPNRRLQIDWSIDQVINFMWLIAFISQTHLLKKQLLSRAGH